MVLVLLAITKNKPAAARVVPAMATDGYSRKRTIGEHLIPTMQDSKRHKELKVADLPKMVANASAQKLCEALRASRHRRGLQGIANKGAATGILIYRC